MLLDSKVLIIPLMPNFFSKFIPILSYQVSDICTEEEDNAKDSNADPFAPLDKLYRMEKIKEELIKIRNTFKVAQAEGMNRIVQMDKKGVMKCFIIFKWLK